MKITILKAAGILLGVLLVLFLALRLYVSHEEKKRSEAPGNAAEYDAENLTRHPDSPLRGKTILFLGSSVTEGAAAEGQSFVELFEVLDGVQAVKEAASGTTLADRVSLPALAAFGNGGSYVKRLRELDPASAVDCVVCQLSTNDATMKMPLGQIGDGDARTVTGAMEWIIRYCRDTWGCPVVFYTGSYFESAGYAAMVDRLYELKDLQGIGIIDLYTDGAFNALDPETYDFYMYDGIHPTKAGYAEWWFPKMEEDLTRILTGKEG